MGHRAKPEWACNDDSVKVPTVPQLPRSWLSLDHLNTFFLTAKVISFEF
jgi:hypothetical protein